MEPIEFPEQNALFAANQPEYLPLPGFKVPGPDGIVVSCWRLSYRERFRLLFTGKVWLGLMTFGKPLTPSRLSTKKEDLIGAID
jgi:hypothetical protein